MLWMWHPSVRRCSGCPVTCAALSGSELAALRNPAEGLCFGVDRPISELRQSEVARPSPLTSSQLEPSPRTLEPEASYILGCLGHMTQTDPKLRGVLLPSWLSLLRSLPTLLAARAIGQDRRNDFQDELPNLSTDSQHSLCLCLSALSAAWLRQSCLRFLLLGSSQEAWLTACSSAFRMRQCCPQRRAGAGNGYRAGKSDLHPHPLQHESNAEVL